MLRDSGEQVLLFASSGYRYKGRNILTQVGFDVFKMPWTRHRRSFVLSLSRCMRCQVGPKKPSPADDVWRLSEGLVAPSATYTPLNSEL